ncbi:MAG: acylglycerol kinase family protein [Patescibacteria group bacterium]|nr:acylglycerol kinase family protein [Patescibacteria group bacterium]
MYLILVNPEAGNHAYKRIEKKFKRLLEIENIKARIVLVEDLAEIPELIRQHHRPSDQAVVAMGGNATVNATINALANQDIALGIIPISRTNFLARHLGFRNWIQAVKALAIPHLQKSRVGKVGQHYFIGEVQIASRHNLLADYINQVNPIKKFLGLNQPPTNESSDVETIVALDDDLVMSGTVEKMTISLNGVNGTKKLKVETFLKDNLNQAHSLMHGDIVAIASKTKMPVIMGNETIAHTPVEIKGVAKYINLVVPGEKLTEEIVA